jgi:hypothetical protein
MLHELDKEEAFARRVLKGALFYCIHRCTKHFIKVFHLFFKEQMIAKETGRKGWSR